MYYKHSFAKKWLHSLGNRIFINGTEYLAKDADKVIKHFEIKPLKTRIAIGDDLMDKEEINDITYITFPDMKKEFGLTIYRAPAGKRGWKKSQKYILFIAKKKYGLADVPETTIRKRNSQGKCLIEFNRVTMCVRGVGEDFGIPEGQFGAGDVTPWIACGEKKRKGKT